MSTEKQEQTEYEAKVKAIYDKLEESYELWYVDRRDELPTDVYEKLLRDGEVCLTLEDDLRAWDYEHESAFEAVMHAAQEAGYRLQAPTVSIDGDDLGFLIETVIERQTDSVVDYAKAVASGDQVIVGVSLSEEYYNPGVQEDQQNLDMEDDLRSLFGVPDKASAPWLDEVMDNGYGHPVMLCVVRGDDLIDLAEQADHSKPGEVELVGYDVGLFCTYSGGGWVASSPDPIYVRMPYEEFLRKFWIDNDPGRVVTWTATVGGGWSYGGQGRIGALYPAAMVA